MGFVPIDHKTPTLENFQDEFCVPLTLVLGTSPYQPVVQVDEHPYPEKTKLSEYGFRHLGENPGGDVQPERKDFEPVFLGSYPEPQKLPERLMDRDVPIRVFEVYAGKPGPLGEDPTNVPNGRHLESRTIYGFVEGRQVENDSSLV